MQQGRRSGRQQLFSTKQIFLLFILYIMLILATNIFHMNDLKDQNIYQKINNPQINVTAASFLRQILYQPLQGSYLLKTGKQTQIGHFYLTILRNSQTFSNHHIIFDIMIKMGTYFEDGIITIQSQRINIQQLQVTRELNKLICQLPNFKNSDQNKTVQIQNRLFVNQYQKFWKINQQIIQISDGQIQYESNNQNSLVQKTVRFLYDQNFYVQFHIQGKTHNFIGYFCLSIILLVIGCSQFSTIIKISEQINNHTLSIYDISFVTMLLATIWDALFCLLSFIEAFQSDVNIIMFIFQTCIFFFIFMNIQIRLLSGMSIRRFSDNPSLAICKFTICFYSIFPILYTLILLTNSENIVIILLSLIFIPQIVTNAYKNHRPQLSNTYYRSFLLLRFLFIFYLKAFPYNIYELKPNLPLVITISILLILQIGWIKIQQVYGPRKFFIMSLFPEIYNYNVQLASAYTDSTEQSSSAVQNLKSQECAICLQLLSEIPNQNSKYKYSIEDLRKYMKTPCGHIYHACCLKTWMKIKMQCPYCRMKLPASL